MGTDRVDDAMSCLREKLSLLYTKGSSSAYRKKMRKSFCMESKYEVDNNSGEDTDEADSSIRDSYTDCISINCTGAIYLEFDDTSNLIKKIELDVDSKSDTCYFDVWTHTPFRSMSM